MGKVLPVQATTKLFASLLQEMDILRPSLGHGVINQIQFSSSSSTLPMGRFMFIIHVTASQYLIALCCLIPKKKTQTHFFCWCRITLPAHEGGKYKNLFLQTSLHLKGFKAWVYFLRKELKTKEKGKSVTKESMNLGVRIAWFKKIRWYWHLLRVSECFGFTELVLKCSLLIIMI